MSKEKKRKVLKMTWEKKKRKVSKMTWEEN